MNNYTSIMKKAILALALIFSLSTFAQDTSTFKKETIEFIKLTGSADLFKSAIDQVGMMVPAEKKEAYKKEAMATLDDLYGDLADLYMEEFTHDDVKELTAFYKTDLGKKLAAKQGLLAQKGMSVGQTWGMGLSQIAQKHSN